jgi:MerR family Zn(II)-responsive transcriptional regulator of zntA
MLIQELANKTGLSKDTIRFYEKIGIIQVPKNQRLSNNYKNYSEDTFALLLLVKKAKAFGFRLSQIKIWIQEWKNGEVSLEFKIQTFEEQIKLVEQKIQEFEELKASLQTKLQSYYHLRQHQRKDD